MNLNVNDLIRDELFQLNTVLWLSQPLPRGHGIKPILYQAGFTVYAIAPLLPIPLDLRLAAQQLDVVIQVGVRPDVVVSQPEQKKFALIECKKSSFGTLSSTAEQARSLLLTVGPRAAEIFALSGDAITSSVGSYLLPISESVALSETLSELQKELQENALPAGNTCILALQSTTTDLGITFDRAGSDFFSLSLGLNPFVELQSDTDPRPLYFIPYDPDINQSEDERLFCKRVLFERIHSTIVTAVGRANPPTEIVLESNSILNDAMFGMFEHWENAESAKHMRSLCKQFMVALTQAVNSELAGTLSFQPNVGWKVILQDDVHHVKALDALTRFSSISLDLQSEPPPSLFDNIEGS